VAEGSARLMLSLLHHNLDHGSVDRYRELVKQ